MAMDKMLKAKMAQYMKGKGVDAPEDFMATEMPEAPEMEDTETETMADHIAMIKQAPDYDLVAAIRMLIEELPVEEPMMD